MDLQKMMDLPGALAAFTYADKGDLQSHVLREGTELTPQVLDLLANLYSKLGGDTKEALY